MGSFGTYGALAVIFVFLLFLNRLLVVPQQLRLNKNLTELKKRGPVSSVGTAKSFIGGMRIAVLITDTAGTIQEAYRVKGQTIFSGYELDTKFPYTDCYQAKEALSGKEKLSLQEQAYLSAATYLVNGLSKPDDPPL